VSNLTVISERIAAEAVASAISAGVLEVIDDAGQVLAKFDMPQNWTFDPVFRFIRFPDPAAVKVEKMGNPARYRVVSKMVGGATLLEGSAGKGADLDLPKRLFVGQGLSVDGVQYQLRFGGTK
jgi:hypothetical protein